MKKIIIVCFIGIISCNSESDFDCFTTTGNIVEQEFNVDQFKKIIVFSRVSLYFSQGETQKIVIQTGGNLINQVTVKVEDSILKVYDNNSCNFVREYGVTKVFVTSPNIEEISNRSGLDAYGVGRIAFRKLILVSEDITEEGEIAINGGFVIDDLDVKVLGVKAGGISNFFLKGKAASFGINAVDSDVRVEAGELNVKELFIYHRSTNKLIVNPEVSIRGRIVGLGDVISKNRPPIVEVEELYTGKLIFE